MPSSAPPRPGAKALTDQARARAAIAAARASGLVRTHRRAHPGDSLTASQALRENGFTVFRGLFSRAECESLAAQFKREAGITPGETFMNVDAMNRFEGPRQVMFDRRILDSVRDAVGSPARFLQVSDLHYLHDTASWHRDSVHRAHDSSDAADWSDGPGNYGVVKAILYLESDNAAMGLMCGSHLSPIEMDATLVADVEKMSGQVVVGPQDDPNRRFSAAERRVPLAWQALVGDVLVFDERMYHAGRRVDAHKVTKNREAAKFTLSMVFGPQNMHSERLYSYFRFARRELYYKDFVPSLEAGLIENGLLLERGQHNYYLEHPEELRLATLRDPGQMDELVAQFTREGASAEGR